MKIGSLCTGYGGLDMAVEAYFNAETIWCAEIDKYASQLIKERFDIPNHGNIKSLNWANLEKIDILTAGYPCQPFSAAGHRKGVEDERHIWPFILEGIGIIRPSIVILENVRGHLSLGFKEVLEGLASIGYDARWKIVRASDVGAPHQRARLFIIAYPSNNRQPQRVCSRPEKGYSRLESNAFITNSDCECGGSTASNKTPADSNADACSQSQRIVRGLSEQSAGLRDRQNEGQARKKYRSSLEMVREAIPDILANDRLNPQFVEYMMGLPKGWVTDLDITDTNKLKMLGNGVVPQQAYYAIQQLMELNTPFEQDLS
jgi:DNA (cytosine-5)-methyltransferase 1